MHDAKQESVFVSPHFGGDVLDPTRSPLDGLMTRRSIAVTSTDFHSVLGNSRALTLAGIGPQHLRT